jgi:hypothetical protein
MVQLKQKSPRNYYLGGFKKENRIIYLKNRIIYLKADDKK